MCVIVIIFLHCEAATALVEGKLGKSLKKVLKKVVAQEAHEQLAISDAKLGGVIKVSFPHHHDGSGVVGHLLCKVF